MAKFSESARGVLARINEHGVYMWDGDIAIVDDPWRSTAHVASVKKLLREGLVAEAGEWELTATDAGRAVLANPPALPGTSELFTVNGHRFEISTNNWKPASSDDTFRSIVRDSLRVVGNSEPGRLTLLFHAMLAQRSDPLLTEIFEQGLDIAAPDPAGDIDAELHAHTVDVNRL